jgi:hypothetical protein
MEDIWGVLLLVINIVVLRIIEKSTAFLVEMNQAPLGRLIHVHLVACMRLGFARGGTVQALFLVQAY